MSDFVEIKIRGDAARVDDTDVIELVGAVDDNGAPTMDEDADEQRNADFWGRLGSVADTFVDDTLDDDKVDG